MKTLPFSKLTLQFHNNKEATQYQEYILYQRLAYFRIALGAALLNSLVSLIFSIIQQWEHYIVILTSLHVVFHFLGLLVSKKCSPYFDLIFPLVYIAYFVSTGLISIYNISQQQYIFGYLNGVLLSSLLNYSSLRVKIFLLITSTWIMFGVFGIYKLINLNYIVYAIGTNALQILSSYIYEYNSRINFLQGMIIKQQNNMMYEFTNEKILILNFNKDKSFFQLDFVNQKFESIYNIENNQDKLNEFLRNHFIKNLAGHQMLSSLKVQKYANKQITLEDLLFEKYRTKSKDVEELNQYEMIDQNKCQHDIQVKILNGLNTLFIIIFKESSNNIQIEKYEKKMQIMNNLSTNFSILVGSKLQSIYKSIFDLEIYQYENSALKKIQGSIQYILNESKNQLMFFSQNRINQLLQEIDNCSLSTIIMSLKPYFIYQCQKSKKQFELLFEIDQDNVQMKINTKQLTQILINIFNKIITYSKSNSIILLRITKEQNLNPLLNIQQQQSKQSKQSSQLKQEYLCSSQENNQLLINFNFAFYTNDEIINFERCFINQKNEFKQKDDLITIINSYLLKQISPYNQIFIIQEKESGQLNLMTTLKFYIYADQTQIDPSYCKYLKQKNIIE